MMTHPDLTAPLTALWEKAVQLNAQGRHDHARWFTPEEQKILDDIGVRTCEVFDFAEDYNDDGVPSLETFLRVHELRRDYFLDRQQGRRSSKVVTADDVPGRKVELGGYPWLPRIIAKAHAKLRGELDPDLMYGCGGDRAFLRQHGLSAEDFLKAVRDHENDAPAILDWVEKHRQP